MPDQGSTNQFREGWDRIFGPENQSQRAKTLEEVLVSLSAIRFKTMGEVVTMGEARRKEIEKQRSSIAMQVCRIIEHESFIVRVSFNQAQCVACNRTRIVGSRHWSEAENKKWEEMENKNRQIAESNYSQRYRKVSDSISPIEEILDIDEDADDYSDDEDGTDFEPEDD